MDSFVQLILILTFLLNLDSGKAITCIQCDSKNPGEENCGFITDPQSTCESSFGCFTQLYYNNDTEIDMPGLFTTRGCVPSGSFLCASSECVKCNTNNNCNNQLFPSNRNKCLTCVDSDCKSPKSEYCEVHGSNECITFYDDDGEILLKSCYSDIKTPTRELCDDENYLNCRKCSGENCNADTKREGQRCFQCEGTECIDPFKFNAPVVDCRLDCYIGLNDNGEAVRGCASDFSNSHLCTSNDEISSSCYVCKDDFCNAILHPKNGRLRCHTCSGDNCEASEDNVEYCPTVSSTEKCVTVFSQTENVVHQRGCLSSFSSTCNNLTCLTCSYDKCNKDDSKYKNQFCIGCNSIEDSNCLKANQNLEKRCSTSSCYSRLIQHENEMGLRVERGCLSDLSGGCSAGSGCQECQGKNCNNQLVPPNRISCFACKNEECLTSLTSKICSQYIQNEACVTFFGDNNQVIYRDCYADAPVGTRNVCDVSSNLECTKCTGNLCNIDVKRRGSKCFRCSGISCFTPSLADLVDCESSCYVGLNARGEIVRDCASSITTSNSCGSQNSTCMTCTDDYCNGILYPTANRKMCIKCSGRDCEGNLDEKSEFCEVMSSSESCVTIFDAYGSIKERGCSSSVSNNCSDDLCLKCSFNNCNTQLYMTQNHYCVSCDSLTDPTCINQSNSPKIKACSTNQCFSKLISQGTFSSIRKGCAADEACSSPSCTSCSGDLCNNILYPSDRRSCLSCIGNGCTTATPKFCTNYSQNQSCITIYNENNQVSYRDCHSDSALGTQNICDDSTSLTCTKCTSNNCNNDVVRRGNKCYQCEGNSCFNEINYPADVVDCTSSCYVGVNSKGETVRGCANKFINSSYCDTNEDGTGNCFICDGDFCNEIKYPMKNRLSCYKCANGCEATDNLIDYCEIAGNTERCVTAFDSQNNVIERGCSMTLKHKLYCSQNYTNCIECSGPNCNKINSKNDRICVACNSAMDPDCVLNPASVLTTKVCASSCYTRVSSNVSGDLTRGCLEDIQDVQCTDANLCRSCNSRDKCNVENYPDDRKQCFTCNDFEGCKNLTSKLCVKYDKEDKCVTVFDGYKPSTRGCFSDQSESTHILCGLTTSALCSSCSANNCNSDSVRRDEQCIVCNSNSEPKCSQNPNLLSKRKCEAISDGECFARVLSDGTTQRGCKGSLQIQEGQCRNNTMESQCMINFGSNSEIIPLNRLKCFACDSRVDENCKNDQTVTSVIVPCRNFVRPEQCVTIMYSDGRVARGCQADFPSSTCNDQKCLLCSNRNGCNSNNNPGGNAGHKISVNKFLSIFVVLVFFIKRIA